MFKRLRVKQDPKKVGPDPEGISISQLIGVASLPVSIKALNSLPDNPKLRLYRTLIPIQVLADFDINPRTWMNPDKLQQVKLVAEPGSPKVQLSAWYGEDPHNEFFYLELADNQYNGIDLNFLVANNPTHQRFQTDVDTAERDTLFGTVRRNLDEEIKAMQAGLAPGQVRAGLRVLLQGIKASRSQSGDLRLAGVQPNVLKVLNLSGFTHILKLFDELDAAVASYS